MADDKQQITERFLAVRTIVLTGKIDRESCETVINQLTRLQFASATDPVKLIINSPGGVTFYAMMLCDFIDTILKVPVHGIVNGQCNSAATFILLSCTVRKATSHSEFVIHSGTMTGVNLKMDTMTKKNLEDFLLEVTEPARVIADMYAKKLNITAEKAQELLDRGDQDFNNALSAEEAKELGLITEIVTEKLDIFPDGK